MTARRRRDAILTPESDEVIALNYRRVSSAEQKIEGLSLAAQAKESKRYILRFEDWVIGQEFEDVLSGRRDDRVNYQLMLSTIRQLRAQGKRVVVVVVALDRLGRNSLERIRTHREMTALGVEIHSVREGGVIPEFAYNILAAMAQEESRRTGERVKASRAVAREAGWVPVGRVLWGYRLRDATPEERRRLAPQKVYDLHPDQAPYAREAWRMLCDGAHIRSIHRWVSNLPPDALGGRKFTYSTLRDYFHSPTSAGRLGRIGDPVPVLQRPHGNWPPLIDDDTWRKAQVTLARHRRIAARTNQLHLLSGFLRCPRCRFRMSGRGGNPVRRGVAQPRYNCQAGNGNKDDVNRAGDCTFSCQGPSVDASVLEQVRWLFRALDHGDWRLELTAAWEALRAPEAEAAQARRVKQLRAQIERNRALTTNATRQYAAEEITRENYDDLVRLLTDESRRAREEIERLTGERPAVELPSLDAVLGDIGGWAEAINSDDAVEARAVLAELVESAVPVKRRHGYYEAEITWTPLGQQMKLVADAAREH